MSRITGGTPCSQTSLLKPLCAITLLHASILHWLVEQFGLITDYMSTDIIVTDVKRHISEPPAAMIQVNCGGALMNIISNVKPFAFYALLVSKAATRQPTSLIACRQMYIYCEMWSFELCRLQRVQYYSINDANKSWQHLNKERLLFFLYNSNRFRTTADDPRVSSHLNAPLACVFFLFTVVLFSIILFCFLLLHYD